MSSYVERVDKAAKDYAKEISDWPEVRQILTLAFTHGATFGLDEARKMLREPDAFDIHAEQCKDCEFWPVSSACAEGVRILRELFERDTDDTIPN